MDGRIICIKMAVRVLPLEIKKQTNAIVKNTCCQMMRFDSSFIGLLNKLLISNHR